MSGDEVDAKGLSLSVIIGFSSFERPNRGLNHVVGLHCYLLMARPLFHVGFSVLMSMHRSFAMNHEAHRYFPNFPHVPLLHFRPK
jgi:hypothetical protein